jgi:hypothetical protein
MDCNREQAVNTNSSNTSIWTNEVSSGIQLDPGDTVSVHSAFINEIGSGADTIEFLGKYVTTTSLTYTTTSPTGPLSSEESVLYDNKVSIAISYYKNADADNVLILPRLFCWKGAGPPDDASDDGLPAKWNQFITYDHVPGADTPRYASLYRRKHDARRYTIYQVKDNPTIEDVALNEWQVYRQRLDFAVDTGYNTPADISSRLTEALHASQPPHIMKDSDGFPYSVVCPSTVYQEFNCAHSAGFTESHYNASDQSYRDAYRYIGVLRPDLFEAGKALDQTKMKLRAWDATGRRMTLEYEYTPANVALWKDLFDAQLAQFDSTELFGDQYGETTRLIHVNYDEGSLWTQLGNDTDLTYMSVRQPIDWDPSFASSYTIEKAYGAIYNDNGFIQFKLQQAVFKDTTPATTARYAGWDVHFSAFASDCILLWSGVQPYNAGTYSTTVTGTQAEDEGGAGVLSITSVYTSRNKVFAGGTIAADVKSLDQKVGAVYLGAINPLISFDTSGSRFYLSGLHTPRKVRNTAQAGSHSSNPLNPDAGNDIYQINPEYFKTTPSFSYNPEQRQLAANPLTQDSDAATDIMTLNLLEYWTVFDASSGICVEDWGVPELHWDECLWAKLGFTYAQLHAPGNRQARATNTAVNMSPVSTNADVNSTQTTGWSVNIWGAPQELSQLPVMGTQHIKETTVTKTGPAEGDVQNREIFRLGTVTQPSTSTRITATRLPVKQTSSYWTIRSSLIDNSLYFNSQGMMPVIAVVDKSYSGSDFYFMSDSKTRFTITKPKVLTAITSSVHLPDGRLARTDGNSCVIYEITKAPPLGNTSKA